jgi:lysophospholipase L1-like esterase
MKTILCYGDSNTWGFIPVSEGRYDHKTRWPGALNRLLNQKSPLDDPEWLVVEEGLCGRTSCREDPVEGDLNGLRQLLPILKSHRPIDIVAVMLGTNDLKPRFNPTAHDIARGVQQVVFAIQKSETGPNNTPPKVLMICPPPTVNSPVFSPIFGDSVSLSQKLPPLYSAMAAECGAAFLDAGSYIKTSPADGIHFEAKDHLKLAAAVMETVLKLF